MYDLTALKTASTFGDVLITLNDATEGTLFGLAVVAIFFIMLFVMKRFEFQNGLLTAATICFIISAILVYGKFINFLYPLAFLIITALTGLYVWMNND
jgi:hypothetical protein